MYQTQYQKHQALHAQMVSARQNYLDHWRELCDWILPHKGRFLVNDTSRGQKKQQKIIDTRASISASNLASGLMSGMTNPARMWFNFATPVPALMELMNVKVWLTEVETIIADILLGSNFYTVLPGMYEDTGVFATAAMSILEDDKDVVRFEQFPIGSFCLGQDHQQRTNRFSQEFTLTVSQMQEKFKRENMSLRVNKMIDSGKESETLIEIFQIITPNANYDEKQLESKYKKFIACTYELGCNEGKTLLEEGFDEFPIAATRWKLNSRDVYGNGPGWTALPHVKELQFMHRKKSQAVEKMVNPPMKGPAEMQGQRASTAAGDITYVNERQGQNGFTPVYEVNPRTAELQADIEDRRRQISECFLENLFLMFSQSDRREITAEEILKRHEEKVMVVGPVLGRFDEDLLKTVIDRVFAIAARRGMLPEAPPELQGMALKTEYKSILHQAQKLASMSPNLQLLEQVERIAPIYPEILDKIDLDQFIDESANILGSRPKVVRSDEQVAAIRAARAKAQAQAQKIAEMEQASKAAKNLAQSPMDGDNALSRLSQQLTPQR